jgi:hypothetical protein
MNATDRIAAKGIEFKAGQEVVIPSYPTVINHTLEVGEYVVLDGGTLQVVDVADNIESAETYSLDLGENRKGHVIVRVDTDGQEVFQGWRDEVADCWGFEN